MGLNSDMRSIFLASGRGLKNVAKLQMQLLTCYKSMSENLFWDDFIYHLKYFMVIYRREPAVDRTIDFVAEFVTSLQIGKQGINGTADEQEVTRNEDEMHPFLLKFFHFLLNCHGARDRGVRFRTCQLVNKLLNYLGEDAQIDDELFESIYQAMLQRVKDKFPAVRVQAVTALTRLQDPSDKGCPIIAAYMFLLEKDPHPDVRRAVLSSIAVSRKTLPVVIGRTCDVKETVRKLAYQVLSEKVHIKGLPIAQRVQLLNRGLNERADVVKNACSQKLLQSWLRMCKGSILELLKCLDVENSCDTAELALNHILADTTTKELADSFIQFLNEDLVIHLGEITSEAAIYWKCLCSCLKSQGVTGEEHMERILPNLTHFCNYVQQFILGGPDTEVSSQAFELKLQRSFIGQQLLAILTCCDSSDEVGRKCLSKLVDDLLISPAIDSTLVKSLMAHLSINANNKEAHIQHVVELIAEIRDPISSMQTGITEEEQHQRDLDFARLRVLLMEHKDELEESIKQQDFTRAGKLKGLIAKLEQEKHDYLKDKTFPDLPNSPTEKNDEETIMKALTIAKTLLEGLSVSILTPALQSLLQTLILPAIQHEDPALRQSAVECLGLCCLISKELARTHLLLFIQILQVDQEAIQVAALQVIFDLLLSFGLEAFTADASSSSETNKEQSKENMQELGSESSDTEGEEPIISSQDIGTDTASSIICILSGLIDNENPEIRTVAAEGMAKLMLSGRAVSSKLLSHLLLLWYNPLTKDDTVLMHCLGSFFPVFAFASKANQECVAEAFLPTLRTLFQAPSSSPLADVNDFNVAELMIELTSASYLPKASQKDQDETADSIHDGLAVKIANEILSNPDNFGTITLCKALSRLDLAVNNYNTRSDLQVLSANMLGTVKNKQCIRFLEKFQAILNHVVVEFAKNNNEQTNELPEPVENNHGKSDAAKGLSEEESMEGQEAVCSSPAASLECEQMFEENVDGEH